MADVVVSRRSAEVVRRGHPWIYRSAVTKPAAAATGAVVRVTTDGGEIVGAGLWDESSPIAVRVWSVGAGEARGTRATRVDAVTFRGRLESAMKIRERLFGDGQTTAYRILHGEGDRTPGFVIDRYADVAVLRVDGDAARAAADRLLADVEEPLRAAGITSLLDRISRRGAAPDIRPRFGSMKDRIEVKEHGVPFVVDLARGQKTGAFLDQRENRRRIGEIVARRREGRREGETKDVRVLNLFSYAGGFSLRAALAGGVVTSVDVALAAHATAQESFRLAGVPLGPHTFATADCFAWLAEAKRKGSRFDVVISDPPSFAPSEKAKAKGLAAYRTLHRACADVLADGGTLVAASCSSHVGAEEFASTLDDATLGRTDLRLLELFGPPADHPTLPTFPEGRYLKLAILE